MSLKETMWTSEGWKKFPMLDVLAGVAVAVVAVVLEKIYGGNAPYAIAFLMAVGGIVVALPFDYVGRRPVPKPRVEAVKGIVYGIRVFLIVTIFSVLSILLLSYI